MTKNPKFLGFVQWFVACLAACTWGGCLSPSTSNDPRVFRYNESASITSLDPAQARSLEHMWIVDQLYDGLVELTADLKVVPCLATSWELDSSLTTYTFHLRRDVQFTTGRPLTARDVQFSLERLRDSTVISSGGWILESVQPGGIKAVDDSTLVIQLIQAYPPFLGLLTTAYASVMDANEARKPGWEARTDVIGSGPFQLAWWLPDAGIVMHRNEAYWEVDEAGSSLPTWKPCMWMCFKTWGENFWG